METKILTIGVKYTAELARNIEELMKQGYTQGQFTCNQTTLFIIMNPPRTNLNCKLTGVAQ